MELELIKLLREILSGLPVGVSSIVAAILGAYLLHRAKWFPYRITKQGQNGSTIITADMLKKNCREYHDPIETKLDTIYARQSTVLEEVSNIKGYLEGAMKRQAGRR